MVNGTAGGAVPSGLGVFLLVSDESGALVHSSRAETDSDGGFAFPEAPLVPGGRYLINVSYAGVDYSRILTLDQATERLTLMVYETTQDISAIQVTRHVLVIADVDAKNRRISALELVRFSNASDHTLNPDLAAAPPMSFLRFSLPPQTTGLNVNSDLPAGEVISVGTGFAVTSPIAPGDHNIEYSFTFPYRGDGVSYRQNLLQGAAVYQVMAPAELATIRVDPLSPATPADIQGTRYRVWEINDLDPGQGFTLEISNLPQPAILTRLASILSGTSFWQTAIPVLLGAALALALGLGILNRPRFATDQPSSSGRVGPSRQGTQNSSLPGTRQDLIMELAALDQRFELGHVPPEEYNSTRQILKDRILELPPPVQNPADASPS